MAANRRSGGLLLIALALACGCFHVAFVPSPQAAPVVEQGLGQVVAVSAAFPALAVMADAAHANPPFGTVTSHWAPVLVPLTGLVLPFVAMAMFTLYVFSEDAFWNINQGSRKHVWFMKELLKDPAVRKAQDPLGGLINRDDWEKGLEESWDKAKPDGCPITVKDKLKELATQNAPHFWRNEHGIDEPASA